jgi:hypothetical protein
VELVISVAAAQRAAAGGSVELVVSLAAQLGGAVALDSASEDVVSRAALHGQLYLIAGPGDRELVIAIAEQNAGVKQQRILAGTAADSAVSIDRAAQPGRKITAPRSVILRSSPALASPTSLTSPGAAT